MGDATLTAKVDKLFDNMDRDKDGKVSVAELTKVVNAIPDLAAKLGLNDMEHCMKVADLDHNGFIDREEFRAYLEKHGSPFGAPKAPNRADELKAVGQDMGGRNSVSMHWDEEEEDPDREHHVVGGRGSITGVDIKIGGELSDGNAIEAVFHRRDVPPWYKRAYAFAKDWLENVYVVHFMPYEPDEDDDDEDRADGAYRQRNRLGLWLLAVAVLLALVHRPLLYILGAVFDASSDIPAAMSDVTSSGLAAMSDATSSGLATMSGATSSSLAAHRQY